MLEVGRAEAGCQFAAMGHGDIARFFADYYGESVGGLRYAECRAVAQAKRARNIDVMADRQNAACRFYAPVGDYERAVVER